MTNLTPIESEFATTEEAEAYDAWFQVMAEMWAIIDGRKSRT